MYAPVLDRASVAPHRSTAYLRHLLVAALACLLAYRITIGIDLSDEAYYASFIDGWLKDGIRNSLNLTLHQTAAFVIYPLAWLYHAAMGSQLGLVLFLRAVYATMSLGAMLILMRYLERTSGPVISLATFAYGVCFIPFSLPAPSYNTIGSLGLLAAIALFGLSLQGVVTERDVRPARFSRALAVASVFSWAAADTAYPSLISVLVVFIGLSLLVLRAPAQRRHLRSYAVQFVLVHLAVAGYLILAFGTAHLLDMFHFTNSALHVSGGLAAKAAKTLALLQANLGFTILCAMALCGGAALGLFDRHVRTVILLMGAFGAVMLYCFASTLPALFVQTHDLVVLIALFGVHLPLRAIRRKESRRAMPAVMYCASLAAGLVTAATASNGLFNFPVGGLLASCLGLAFLPEPAASTRAPRAAHVALVGLAAILMAWGSFRFIYGETYGNPLSTPSVRLSTGPFAGLLTSEAQARVIDAIAAQLPQSREAAKGGSIIALGRLPAVYLLTSLSPIALTTWNFGNYPGDEANRMVQRLYEDPAHQPSYVLRYNDRWTAPLTTVEEQLIARYRLLRNVTVDESAITLYRQ